MCAISFLLAHCRLHVDQDQTRTGLALKLEPLITILEHVPKLPGQSSRSTSLSGMFNLLRSKHNSRYWFHQDDCAVNLITQELNNDVHSFSFSLNAHQELSDGVAHTLISHNQSKSGISVNLIQRC
jgi:Uma2 family endonuclease